MSGNVKQFLDALIDEQLAKRQLRAQRAITDLLSETGLPYATSTTIDRCKRQSESEGPLWIG